MGIQYAGELRYVAKCSNGVILEVAVEDGFRVMYDAIKRELKSEVGQSLFYECASCVVSVAYVVERIGSGCYQSQYCFEKKIGSAFASCIDKHTGFDYRREW